MLKKIFIITIFVFSSFSLLANENQSYKGKDFYFDINVGLATHDTGVTATSGTTVDEDDTGYMINLGRRINEVWSVEGMYYDVVRRCKDQPLEYMYNIAYQMYLDLPDNR